ncbi:MAG: glycosyl hydrolase family 17 protein [Halieaceae bacterium]
MSLRQDKHHHLLNPAGTSSEHRTLDERLEALLAQKMHGISFSAYVDGQKPGDELGRDQIERRMRVLASRFSWIRSFSTTQGNDLIPIVAKEHGLKTLVGAWLGKDDDKNRLEMERLIELAHEGAVDIAAVGNEVLYREDLSEDQLLAFMQEARERLPSHIPMGYVDAYYEFEARPNITAACDVLLTNCYPFWEGCAHPYAILYMQDMYRRVQRVAEGKRVIISETGWPSAGGNFYGAESSPQGAYLYFLRAMEWAASEDIEMFYFSSFDESWKVAGDAGEGDVGAHWGLWDKDEQFKYAKAS